MPEGVVDAGQMIGPGHGRRGRERPADVPEDWVRDRATKTWRPPKRPGPKADDGPAGAPDVSPPGDGGWRAERDPDAARLAGEDPGPAKPVVTAGVVDDLAAAMGLVGMVVLPAAARADPYCGQFLIDQWEPVSAACAPLLARSDRLVRWMTSAGGLRDWVGLAIALSPVAEAVVRHHITRTVVVVRRDGEPPLARERDFSDYPAAA